MFLKTVQAGVGSGGGASVVSDTINITREFTHVDIGHTIKSIVITGTSVGPIYGGWDYVSHTPFMSFSSVAENTDLTIDSDGKGFSVRSYQSGASGWGSGTITYVATYED